MSEKKQSIMTKISGPFNLVNFNEWTSDQCDECRIGGMK